MDLKTAAGWISGWPPPKLASVVAGDGASGAVFAVENGRARRVPVSIAFLDGDRAVLAGGVEHLERVVTDGASRLSDGARVRVAP